MRKILLDTSVILRYPKFLALKFPDTSFVITTDVLKELIKRGDKQEGLYKKWTSLINEAITDKTVELKDQDSIEILQFKGGFPYQGMDRGDASLITVGLFFKDQGHDVIIASFDTEVRNVALRQGIEPFNEADVRKLLDSYFTQELQQKEATSSEARKLADSQTKEFNNLQKKVSKFERLQKYLQLASAFGGLFSALAAITVLGKHLYEFLPEVKVWGTFALILSGFLLFYWRERDKVSYGVFELIGGIGAIFIVLFPLSFNFSQLLPDFEKDFKILGGIYIMVRGQDNIVNGLYGTKAGVFLYEKLRIGKKVIS